MKKLTYHITVLFIFLNKRQNFYSIFKTEKDRISFQDYYCINSLIQGKSSFVMSKNSQAIKNYN
jgi:hypothetical protein